MRRCVLAVLVFALGLATRAGTQAPPPEPRPAATMKQVMQAMRDSGIAVAAAARGRSQDRIVALTEPLTESCSACHRTHRTARTPCAPPPRP